ncbi:MAG TPA: hypothetical protein O0X66_03145 [Methanocorpusculum sp.]|nr:hypothetical protein [Methanocorpusculum sp.]HJJ53479.1 hypothetical protein [Methanocorpusculum sp.]
MNSKKRSLSLLVLLLILIFFVGSAYAAPIITIETEKPSYYLGEEVVFSGTNTISDNVYLFIKGANVAQTFLLTVIVSDDDTWRTSLDLMDYRDLDAGTYKIYAATNVDVIGDVKTFGTDYPYNTVSVRLTQPFISISEGSFIVEPGDPIAITGTAELGKGNNYILYYIFGENYFYTNSASVTGTSYGLNIDTTSLANGQYFVVVQHPMYDRVFNIGPVVAENGGYDIKMHAYEDYTSDSAYILFNTVDRESRNVAKALCQALDSQNIDDSYVRVSFIVDSTQGKLISISDVSRSISYPNGDSFTISGVNTDSTCVHLYLQYPSGTRKLLSNSPIYASNDKIWTTSFSHAKMLEAGPYLIYAVAGGLTPPDPSTITDHLYATWTIDMFIAVDEISPVLTMSTPQFITGNVTGTTELLYYIFGTNYFATNTIPVDDDGSYWIYFNTESKNPGQYFVVIQHPGRDGVFNIGPVAAESGGYDIMMNTSGSFTSGQSIYLFNTLYRQSANAAEALCQALDSQNIDDIYMKLTFIVAQPTLTLNSVSDVVKGQPLKVSGTTNLKADTVVTVDVLSTAFTAIDKSSVNSAYFSTLTTKVVKGAYGVNTWEVTFDTTGLNVDTYTIQAVTGALSTSTVIKILSEKAPTGPYDEITLRSGWNFISIPKTLNQTANTAGTLFGSVDTDDKNILGYDPIRKSWVPLRAADIIQPLNGYWIYAATGTTISFTYPSAPTPPSVKTLSPGWNAIGLSAGESTSAKTALTGTSWRTLIPWNLAGAKYDTAIVNSGSDANSPDRLMTIKNGYWLYVDAQSTLVALIA